MKLKLNKFFDQSRIFIIFFLFFLIIYFFNFENYTNTVSTDYGARYKLYGIKIIKDILDLNISSFFYLFGTEQYAFINNYFIPELITGLLLKITPDEFYFYIVSNIVNMLLLFFAINLFFKTFTDKEKEKIVFIFFVFFFFHILSIKLSLIETSLYLFFLKR